jgi:hypothetical protein
MKAAAFALETEVVAHTARWLQLLRGVGRPQDGTAHVGIGEAAACERWTKVSREDACLTRNQQMTCACIQRKSHVDKIRWQPVNSVLERSRGGLESLRSLLKSALREIPEKCPTLWSTKYVVGL